MPVEDVQDIVRHWRYTPTHAYLANPHKGCCTFQRFNGDPLHGEEGWSEEGPLWGAMTTLPLTSRVPGYVPPLTASGFLPSTVAYCRWFWERIEPRQGEYDFSIIDRALMAAELLGQTLAVRLMPFGYVDSGQPDLPVWYDKRYLKREFSSGDFLVPDYDSKEYYELWGGLVRAFAMKYDGHKLIESIDVAFVGPWGEGHGDCSPQQTSRFAELWRDAFVETPRLAMIGGDPHTSDQFYESTSRGSGWRADCFGDLRKSMAHPAPIHLRWNHMYNSYPRRLHEAKAQSVWKRAPVHMETCETPADWYRQGLDIDFIIEQGFKYHITYFTPKSKALPEAWMDKIADFCEKIGYRYIFRQATLSRRTVCEGSFIFRAWIENVGVAPLYRKYVFALRLRQNGHEEIIILDDVDVTAWLPGDVWLDQSLSVPKGFGLGYIEISAGLLDPTSKIPRIQFAVEERFQDRWMLLGGIEITT